MAQGVGGDPGSGEVRRRKRARLRAVLGGDSSGQQGRTDRWKKRRGGGGEQQARCSARGARGRGPPERDSPWLGAGAASDARAAGRGRAPPPPSRRSRLAGSGGGTAPAAVAARAPGPRGLAREGPDGRPALGRRPLLGAGPRRRRSQSARLTRHLSAFGAPPSRGQPGPSPSEPTPPAGRGRPSFPAIARLRAGWVRLPRGACAHCTPLPRGSCPG